VNEPRYRKELLSSLKNHPNETKMNLTSLATAFGDSNTKDKKKNKKQQRRRAILMLAIYLFTSASFAQFLTEEAIQNYGFGVMSLVMNDDYDLLREELPHFQAFHNKCQNFMYVTYCLNPLTGYYFQFFMESNQRKIDIWEKQIERHDSRFREIVAGEVRDAHVNGDGTGVISIDTGSVVQNVYVPFPEILIMPREGDLIQIECAKKWIRGSQHLELVRMGT